MFTFTCRLYNKEAVLEFLIDRSKFECAASFQHLRGLTVSAVLLCTMLEHVEKRYGICRNNSGICRNSSVICLNSSSNCGNGCYSCELRYN